MSHKNLAKVIIDPGRTSGSTYTRRRMRRKQRTLSRRMCRRITKGEDWSEAEAAEFDRGLEWWDEISFDDRINPLKRYLDKQVGRPWNKVYSELKAKFDERKLCNWHLMEHVRGYVILPDNLTYQVLVQFGWHYVDGEGILRFNRRSKRR